jgi:uncharacterized MAPEG superfamily protein
MFFNTAQNAVNFTWYNFFLALIFYSENMNCVIIPCAKFPLHTYIYTYIHIYIYIYICDLWTLHSFLYLFRNVLPLELFLSCRL